MDIGIPDEDPLEDEPVCLAGWQVPIADYFHRSGASADYDFGEV